MEIIFLFEMMKRCVNILINYYLKQIKVLKRKNNNNKIEIIQN